MEINKTMSEQIDQLATALSIAQGSMENAKKDSNNPFFKSKYADLSAIVNAGKEAMKSNGLAISQIMEPDTEKAIVITLLMHKSGQWIKSTVSLKPTASTPQAMGSAITYARRYGYQAILGLSAEDDDGNSASTKTRIKCTEEIVELCANKKGLEIPENVLAFSEKEKGRAICYPCQMEMKRIGTWVKE